jgi:hypothetical protein
MGLQGQGETKCANWDRPAQQVQMQAQKKGKLILGPDKPIFGINEVFSRD